MLSRVTSQQKRKNEEEDEEEEEIRMFLACSPFLFDDE